MRFPFSAVALFAFSVAALPSPRAVHSTTLSGGQVLDWIPIEAQGSIAKPPPLPRKRNSSGAGELSSLLATSPQGPPGTVPVLRRSEEGKSPKKQLPSQHDDGADTALKAAAVAGGNTGKHWYASSAQAVDNLGAGGVFSMYKTFVESPNDFSLLQTAVIRNNAPSAKFGNITQTIEAGWMNFPKQSKNPHLFTYFTAVGYQSDVDYLGGWNKEVKGWVQTDKELYPGFEVKTLSVDGGAQYDVHIEYKLFEDNWWLFVLDRYIGYYPASLFNKDVDSKATLADHASQVDFYGEVYNSGDALTTTDMGSGQFPDAGFGHVAYIHNMVYTDVSNSTTDYDGGSHILESDKARYRIQPMFKSGSSWGSFAYIGGPGAGGVVGG